VTPGTPGEICVAGAGVARGYLNRPELTSRRFLPDPFSDEPGARLYRSGDLAQVNPNGELEYLAAWIIRFKIRWFRVELGEIQSALNGHPGVRESVVISQDTSAGDKRCCLRGPAPNRAHSDELREHLLRKVPDYMVPAVFLFLNALPLTTNGKVDRRALPSPDGARPELRLNFGAPDAGGRSAGADLERRAGDGKGCVHDNFFELGGDSIRSITILSRAQQAGLHFTLQQIFSTPDHR